MRRVALFTGLAIGYVLGARAGRERYEQIGNAYRAFRQSQPAQQLSAQVSDSAAKAGHTIREKAAAGVARGTDKLRRNSNGATSGTGL
jgi:hypothetical protein